MRKKRKYYTQEQRREMANTFAKRCSGVNWKIKWDETLDSMTYLSNETKTIANISFHFIQRCQERCATTDTFFVALESFFQTNKKAFIKRVREGKKFAICSQEAGVAFIAVYQGYDYGEKKFKIKAITALPFKSFDDTYFYSDTDLFTELVVTEMGDFEIEEVSVEKIRFNKNGR